MLKLKKKIEEGKQVGTLYHVCRPNSFIYNIKNNSITPGSNANNVKGKDTISFTRDKGLIVDTVYGSPILFQMVIDGDTLSNNMKIQPFVDPYLTVLNQYDTEKEEIAFSSVEDLKLVLQGVNIFIVESEIYRKFSSISQSYYTTLLEALELAKKSGVSSKISVIASYDNPRIVQSTVPKDLPSFIDLINNVIDYDSVSVTGAIKNILSSLYGNVSTDKTGRMQIPLENSSIRDVADVVNAITEIIQEQLGAKDIIVAEEKYDNKPLRRHGGIKLSTILNNRTYKISSLVVSPVFEWVNRTSPWVKLNILTSKDAQKSFYVYFI